MPILIPCKCGKQLRVKDDLAGKRIKCPACAALLTVPIPELADDEPIVPELASAADVAHPPEPSRAKKHSRPDEGEEEAGDSAVEPAGKARKRPRAADGPNPYWVRAGDLLALSDEAIYLASLNEKEMRRARAALDDGEPPALVLDGASLVISYDHIQKVESNVYHEIIEVSWKAPGDAETTESNLVAADKESRDEIMEALRDCLGPEWKKDVVEYTRLRASWPPLVVIGIFGFLTFCFYMAAAHPESDKSSGGGKVVRTNVIGAIFVWVFNLFGPVPVFILGGIFVAAGVAWLVARMIKPPIMLTLSPREGRRKKRRG